MSKSYVEEFVESQQHMRLYQQERAIYEVTELLEALMKEQQITRTELAERLGKTKGWVTQLLDGEANKTIRTVADAFAVLGHEYHSSSGLIQIGGKAHCSVNKPSATATEARTEPPVILSFQEAMEATGPTFETTSIAKASAL